MVYMQYWHWMLTTHDSRSVGWGECRWNKNMSLLGGRISREVWIITSSAWYLAESPLLLIYIWHQQMWQSLWWPGKLQTNCGWSRWRVIVVPDDGSLCVIGLSARGHQTGNIPTDTDNNCFELSLKIGGKIDQ